MEISSPYAHVDETLRALAGQAEGFGVNAIGGLHGALYHVTTLEDDGCGSLREGCRRIEPLWIVFEVSGTIQLSSPLRVSSSYKTIDGRGQKVKLTGKGLQLVNCEHIIVCNLEFEGGRGHDVDAIKIKFDSRHIWIDRCSLRDYEDGLIDITCASTLVTISRCYFSMHNKTILIGGCNSHIADRCIRVTIHHCFFDGTCQRQPRVRFGKVHLYNNYIRNWGLYAVCASVESQILSQCNTFEAGQEKEVFKYLKEKAADREEDASGWIKSENDLFLNDAKPCLLELDSPESVCMVPEFDTTCTVQPALSSLELLLHGFAGWQEIPRPAEILCTAECSESTAI